MLHYVREFNIEQGAMRGFVAKWANQFKQSGDYAITTIGQTALRNMDDIL